MGMGDSGRNMAAVSDAVYALTDRFRLSMASSKITVSSVGPSPEAFMTLAAMPATLAWCLVSYICCHSCLITNTVYLLTGPCIRQTTQSGRNW